MIDFSLPQIEALVTSQSALHANSGSAHSRGDKPPASIVPYLQAPSSRGISTQSSSSRSNSTGGASRPGSASGARRATPTGSQGAEATLADGLPQLAFRDWELNLDALEVSIKTFRP